MAMQAATAEKPVKQGQLDNNTYNLMSQLVEEHRSLWQIRKHYIPDADCADCRRFWEDFADQKEDKIKVLQRLLDGHIHS